MNFVHRVKGFITSGFELEREQLRATILDEEATRTLWASHLRELNPDVERTWQRRQDLRILRDVVIALCFVGLLYWVGKH